MNLLRWLLKELLRQKVLGIASSFLAGVFLSFAGWVFDFQEVRVDMEKVFIIASLFISVAMPLIIIFVVTFSVCMAILAILRRVLPSQRFASDAKKILRTLNTVREYLDRRFRKERGDPHLVFQSVGEIKTTVFKKHKIPYPSIRQDEEGYFEVWFVVLSDLYGLAVNADLERARLMRYDDFREAKQASSDP